MTTPTIAPPAPADPSAPIEPVSESNSEMRVRFPCIAIEGQDTRDGRFIDPGKITSGMLPMSIMAQLKAPHGGDDPPAASLAGRLDTIQRQPGPEVISGRTGQPFPEGTFVWSGEGVIGTDVTVDGHNVADLVRQRFLRGTSADLLPSDFTVIGEEGFAPDPANPTRRLVVHAGEIGGLTLVPIAAFGDCYVELADEDTPPDPITPDELPVGLAASAAPSWQSPTVLNEENGAVAMEDESAMTAAVAVATRRPPLSYFADPGFTEETPLTIEEPDENGYRRVYGHIAVWSRPHIGYNGKPVYAPRSKCDYAFFNTGAVRCLDEDGVTRIAAVGHLTMDTSHADLNLSAAGAARHYDHTGYAWADVAVGGDQFGTWSNGLAKPGITDEQVDYAYAHPPSGDWRPINGNLEIVAALCVNTAGIPVSRARVASGQIVALVAAGALPPTETRLSSAIDYEAFADVVVSRLEQRSAERELSARHLSLVTELDDTPAVVASLLAEVDDTPGMVAGLLEELDGEGLTAANWVEKAGGLPDYIKRISKHLQEKGMDQSRAIATAVNVAKKMCATGDLNYPGLQQVNPGSRAEACASVADWERKKAQSHV